MLGKCVWGGGGRVAALGDLHAAPRVPPPSDAAPPKPAARTLDNTREWDDTYVDKEDPELLADEADDEFADIFGGTVPPKIMITTKVCVCAGVPGR